MRYAAVFALTMGIKGAISSCAQAVKFRLTAGETFVHTAHWLILGPNSAAAYQEVFTIDNDSEY